MVGFSVVARSEARGLFALAAVSPAKGGLACAGAAHKRRATVVACVHRSPFGTR